MNQDEIIRLKELVKQVQVYWRDVDGACRLVVQVKMDWVEFQDEPDLKEPAAFLSDGGVVALGNTSASSFYTMVPALAA